MENLLVILPVITPTYADKCIESMFMEDSSFGIPKENVLIVDNSKDGFAKKYGIGTARDLDGHNLGVARAWNVGIDEMMMRGYDYLVILSASMLFGPRLHCTLLEQYKTNWGESVIEVTGHSWHLIAFHRRVFEKVGKFDSNFFPAYFEAVDYSYRMRMVGMEGNWTHIWVNAMSQGRALHNEIVHTPADPLLKYYREKWGGDKGEEKYTLPFGDKPLDYFEDISIPELAKKYKLSTWW